MVVPLPSPKSGGKTENDPAQWALTRFVISISKVQAILDGGGDDSASAGSELQRKLQQRAAAAGVEKREVVGLSFEFAGVREFQTELVARAKELKWENFHEEFVYSTRFPKLLAKKRLQIQCFVDSSAASAGVTDASSSSSLPRPTAAEDAASPRGGAGQQAARWKGGRSVGIAAIDVHTLATGPRRLELPLIANAMPGLADVSEKRTGTVMFHCHVRTVSSVSLAVDKLKVQLAPSSLEDDASQRAASGPISPTAKVWLQLRVFGNSERAAAKENETSPRASSEFITSTKVALPGSGMIREFQKELTLKMNDLSLEDIVLPEDERQNDLEVLVGVSTAPTSGEASAGAPPTPPSGASSTSSIDSYSAIVTLRDVLSVKGRKICFRTIALPSWAAEEQRSADQPSTPSNSGPSLHVSGRVSFKDLPKFAQMVGGITKGSCLSKEWPLSLDLSEGESRWLHSLLPRPSCVSAGLLEDSLVFEDPDLFEDEGNELIINKLDMSSIRWHHQQRHQQLSLSAGAPLKLSTLRSGPSISMTRRRPPNSLISLQSTTEAGSPFAAFASRFETRESLVDVEIDEGDESGADAEGNEPSSVSVPKNLDFVVVQNDTSSIEKEIGEAATYAEGIQNDALEKIEEIETADGVPEGDEIKRADAGDANKEAAGASWTKKREDGEIGESVAGEAEGVDVHKFDAASAHDGGEKSEVARLEGQDRRNDNDSSDHLGALAPCDKVDDKVGDREVDRMVRKEELKNVEDLSAVAAGSSDGDEEAEQVTAGNEAERSIIGEEIEKESPLVERKQKLVSEGGNDAVDGDDESACDDGAEDCGDANLDVVSGDGEGERKAQEKKEGASSVGEQEAVKDLGEAREGQAGNGGEGEDAKREERETRSAEVEEVQVSAILGDGADGDRSVAEAATERIAEDLAVEGRGEREECKISEGREEKGAVEHGPEEERASGGGERGFEEDDEEEEEERQEPDGDERDREEKEVGVAERPAGEDEEAMSRGPAEGSEAGNNDDHAEEDAEEVKVGAGEILSEAAMAARKQEETAERDEQAQAETAEQGEQAEAETAEQDEQAEAETAEQDEQAEAETAEQDEQAEEETAEQDEQAEEETAGSREAAGENLGLHAKSAGDVEEHGDPPEEDVEGEGVFEGEMRKEGSEGAADEEEDHEIEDGEGNMEEAEDVAEGVAEAVAEGVADGDKESGVGGRIMQPGADDEDIGGRLEAAELARKGVATETTVSQSSSSASSSLTAKRTAGEAPKEETADTFEHSEKEGKSRLSESTDFPSDNQEATNVAERRKPQGSIQLPMPDYWEQDFDAESGRPFFRDLATQATTWTDPRCMPLHWVQRAEPHTGRPLFVYRGRAATAVDPRGCPPGWHPRLTPQGRMYFAHSRSQQTTYSDPRGLPPWIEPFLDAKARMYYKNHLTESTTWVDPCEAADEKTWATWWRMGMQRYFERFRRYSHTTNQTPTLAPPEAA